MSEMKELPLYNDEILLLMYKISRTTIQNAYGILADELRSRNIESPKPGDYLGIFLGVVMEGLQFCLQDDAKLRKMVNLAYRQSKKWANEIYLEEYSQNATSSSVEPLKGLPDDLGKEV